MATDTESTIRTLFTGTGIVIFGTIISYGASFATRVLAARGVGPMEYGEVAIGYAILTTVTTLSLLGLDTGIGRYLPRYDSSKNRHGVIVSAFQIAIPISIVCALVFFGFADVLARDVFNDESIGPTLHIFAVAIPFSAFMTMSVGAMRGAKNAGAKVIVQNLIRPVMLLVFVGVMLYLQRGAVGVASAYLLAYVCAGLAGAVYLLREDHIFSGMNYTPMRRRLLRFSLPLVISSTMGMVLTNADTFIIGYLQATEDVGIYRGVYPVTEVIMFFLSSSIFLVMPIISELHANEEFERFKVIYQTVTKWIVVCTLPVVIYIIVFSKDIIKLLLGSQYISGYPVLIVLALGYSARVFSGPNGSTLISIGLTRMVASIDAGITVLNIALNFLLIPRFGIIGAAVATSISYIFQNIVQLCLLYQKQHIIPLKQGPILVAFVAAVISVGMFFLQRQLQLSTVTYAIIFTIVLSSIYITTIIKLDLIGETERELIGSLLFKFSDLS